MAGKIRRGFLIILFNIALILLIFFLCEGLSGYYLLFQDMVHTTPAAERLHTQYDEELGWVNTSNLYIKDMYGPGLDFQTNRQGFRNNEDFQPKIPSDKVRIICSGDSFTLGYGVDNQDSWCHLLREIDPRLQTVNMGQGGYGLDQIYLWFKRDGIKLDYDIHLFTFISHDFERMQVSNFLGYGKPLLKLENDQLVVDNVPVPSRAFYTPWLTQNSDALKQTKTVQLLSQFSQSSAQEEKIELANPEAVVREILVELEAINQAQNSQLVLVFLPTLGDYDPAQSENTERWRHYLTHTAEEMDIPMIDLVETFRELPPEQISALFIHEGEVDFPGAAGHYSAAGNQHFAQHLYEELLTIPEISNSVEND